MSNAKPFQGRLGFDANNNKIINVAAPTALGDGVNYGAMTVPAHTSTRSYPVGFIVEYNNVVYKAKTALAAKAFNAADWTAIADGQLRADLIDPTKGAGVVSAVRKTPNTAIRGTVDSFIANQKVNIWEFADLITSRPDVLNPDTWDWTPAFVQACQLGKRLILSSGTFRLGEITVSPGTQIEGEGGDRFAPRTILTSINAGAKLLTTPIATMSGQRSSFSVTGVRIVSDAGITFGDPNKLVVDGGGTSAYEMKPYVADCSFAPITSYSGYGILLAKAFDHNIIRNDITGFARGIVELGSDIGLIAHNRIINFSEYGILQLGASTFGSQTQIHHNDILGGTTGSTYIKSTGRHVRIVDNYLERSTGSACVGFIDVSSLNTPVYGPNPVKYSPYSVVVENNRIDGQLYATDFIYRYEPASFNAKFVDVGTPGVKNSKPWLIVVGDAVPMYSLSNVGNNTQCRHEFISSGERRWSAFKPEALRISDGGVSFNNLSILYLNPSELRRNNAHLNVFQNDHAILLKSTLGTTLFHCILPVVTVNDVDTNNQWLRDGVSYTVTIMARMVSGTGTLRSLKIVDAASQGIALDTPLTTQLQRITMTMIGAPETSKVGVAFQHNASNITDIEIVSVSFKEV